MYSMLEEATAGKAELVAHLCSRWNQVLNWLNCMETLRKAA